MHGSASSNDSPALVMSWAACRASTSFGWATVSADDEGVARHCEAPDRPEKHRPPLLRAMPQVTCAHPVVGRGDAS
jgi:hypothetical protein